MSSMTIARFPQRPPAEQLQRHLEQQGLHPLLREGSSLGRLWFVGSPAFGSRLEVPADEFAAAMERLQQDSSAAALLQQAIRCPECNSLRVEYPQYTRNSLLTNFMLGLAAAVGLLERDFYCEDCHFTWPREGARPRLKHPHLAPYYFIEGVEQTTRQPPPPPGASSSSSPPPRREAA